MAQWNYVMFLIIVHQLWMHMNKWNLEDTLQPLFRETTSRDILLKLSWRMIGFWVQTGCHGRFTLDAIKDIQLNLWDPLRALTSWPWWDFIVLVGFFMWQIRSLWILFLRMVWKGTIVIPCISCMTMMVLMVIFARDQEQSHQDSMNPPGIAFWRHKSWWRMAMICSWLPMVWFWFMMTFLVIILRLWVNSHIWDIILPVEQVDTVYLLKSEFATGVKTWLPQKSTRNTCHQARYPSTWKMARLLSTEFPDHLSQREEQQHGNSWARKSLRNIFSCSTTSLRREDIQKLVMMHHMENQAQYQLR